MSVFLVNTSSTVSVLNNTGSLSGKTRKAYAGAGEGSILKVKMNHMNKGRSRYYITKSMTHNYDDKMTSGTTNYTNE